MKNEAGQRLYKVESDRCDATESATICYCRVTSTKQRQVEREQVEFMPERYPDSEIIPDIGSGLKFKRKGLQALLVRFMRGDKLTVVIALRDRFCRFGFELFEFMATQNGGSILVLSSPVHCQESELTADLLAILHIFSCRMQSRRNYSPKIKEDPTIPKPRTKSLAEAMVWCKPFCLQYDHQILARTRN
ncbi:MULTISPECIES: IS607 family transposase [unclassified Microcoleus]|uniref:IS607 family transposase n=1 Tax=unclassified Microcoleus TaxID=2642155 RepID=UPI002FD53B6F